MTLSYNRDEDSRYEFARDAIAKELSFRREKQWRIFTWISGFLLVALRGVVVVESRLQFSLYLRIIMACSLAVITAYASVWIQKKLEEERKILKKLKLVDYLLYVIPDKAYSLLDR